MNKIKDFFSDWNMFEKIWLFTFVIVMLVLSIVWNDTPIALVASISGIISVVLCAKGKVSNYYFAILQGLCYIYVSYHAHLYGEVMYNTVMMPVAIIGIITWKKHMDSSNKEVQVRNLTAKWRIIVGAIAVAAIFTYMKILTAMGGALTLIDATSTVLSVIAVILTILRYTEQWVIWLFVDIVSFVMWLLVFLKNGGDITIAVMWFANMINAIYGLYNWNKMAKECAAN